MKKRKKQKMLAILLCILALVLTACGSAKTENEATVNEDVRLSNIRFSYMSLTAEEKKMMESIQEMLKSAEFFCPVDTDDKNYLKLKNTTDYTLDIDFIINCFNEEHELVDWHSFSLNEWKPGEKIELGSWGRSSGTDIKVEKAEILADYVSGTSFYRTDPVELKLTREPDEMLVQLQVEGGLPKVINVSSWSGKAVYSLTEFTFKPYSYGDDKYDFVFMLTKQSGKASVSDQIEYRIIRDDGVVADSDYLYLRYIKPGETVRIAKDYNDLPPGSYTIEFSAKN